MDFRKIFESLDNGVDSTLPLGANPATAPTGSAEFEQLAAEYGRKAVDYQFYACARIQARRDGYGDGHDEAVKQF